MTNWEDIIDSVDLPGYFGPLGAPEDETCEKHWAGRTKYRSVFLTNPPAQKPQPIVIDLIFYNYQRYTVLPYNPPCTTLSRAGVDCTTIVPVKDNRDKMMPFEGGK